MTQMLRPPCEASLVRHAGETACPRNVRPLVLAAAVLGSSMAFIDGAALSVALPQLRDTMGAGPAALNWILNAYMLSLAALTLSGGALADRYGRKRVFLVGVAAFMAASLACGLAPGTGSLIAARAVQGAAGGENLRISVKLCENP